MPSVRSPSARIRSRRNAAHAAVEVADRDAGRTAGRPARAPGCRGSGAASGMAPGSMPPGNRLPITRSAPSRSSRDEAAEVVEVVAVVGVGHQHVRAAGRLDAAVQRGAVAAPRHVAPPGRPRRAAMSCEPSVDPLSATTTSPSTPRRRAATRCALRMQVASVSASFRQGSTTDNSTTAGGVRDSASAETELPVGALGALDPEVVALGDVMTDRSFLNGPTGPVRRATG